MSQSPFRKFIKAKKGSVLKEEIRQEKKQARKEKREFFDNLKKQKAMAGSGHPVKETAKKTTAAANAVQKKEPAPEKMPLNKYLAHCGVSSRRDAAALITEGHVKVNRKVITEPGYKVQAGDEVFFNNKRISVSKNLVYILLNKPKDYLTTTDDPEGRKTVLQLIQSATDERVYPIGRLDRNTSGVLLLTNDGDLTQKLSHPSYEIRKIYEVRLDKPLTKSDYEKIASGIMLEDGLIKVDAIGYPDLRDKTVVGVELHSGRNRIVRRIFEHLHYDVKALDRVSFAGLTKKNVQRGKWRFLNEKEIRLLKFMNASRKK